MGWRRSVRGRLDATQVEYNRLPVVNAILRFIAYLFMTPELLAPLMKWGAREFSMFLLRNKQSLLHRPLIFFFLRQDNNHLYNNRTFLLCYFCLLKTSNVCSSGQKKMDQAKNCNTLTI